MANHSAPVPIPLPPEPPRDRVIEALDADGQVIKWWTFKGNDWWLSGDVDDECGNWAWGHIVAEALVAGLTLQHRPAEEET